MCSLNKIYKQISDEQKLSLYEFMSQHPNLNSGKFGKDFTYKTAQKLWVEITAKLNAIPGSKKSWKQWRKAWQDQKSRTKMNEIYMNGCRQRLKKKVAPKLDLLELDDVHEVKSEVEQMESFAQREGINFIIINEDEIEEVEDEMEAPKTEWVSENTNKKNRELTGILGDLLIWIRDNLLKERPELFLQDNSVRPGILVLVNDSDWELLDTNDYVIQPNDRITFISTLHGG